MKRIGMRTVKTAISVFICLMLFLVLKTVELIPGVEENFAFKWYNPFFAGIATAYSMYPNRKKSIEQAKTRCVASFIGGIVGVLLVLIYEFFAGKGKWPSLMDRGILTFIVPYTLVAIFSILIIIIAVSLKQRQAVFVSILTFLSITVNANAAISSNWGEWVFGINRILSTIIGVLVALGVNMFRLPHRVKNKDLLFCIGIEGIVTKEMDKLVGYMHYKLNNMVYLGANCTLFTTRPPSSFMHILDDLQVNNPIICCGGAAVYDHKNLKYLYKEEISSEDSKEIDNLLDSLNVTPFKNYIVDDVLHIYCKKIDNIGEELYAESKKNAAYCNFDLGEFSKDQNVLYYVVCEHEDKISELIDAINNSALKDKVFIQVYECFDFTDEVPDYKYLKIYSKEVAKLNTLKQYCSDNNLRPVGLITNPLSNHLMNNCEIKVTYHSNIEAVKTADVVLKSNSYDCMFKHIHKMYYSKKYQK